MREWKIEIFVKGEDGATLPATMYEKATYKLHPTFGEKATQGTSSSLTQQLSLTPRK